MCKEVEAMSRKLLCYREIAFWDKIRIKLNKIMAFGLDPLLESRNNIPVSPCYCVQLLQSATWL